MAFDHILVMGQVLRARQHRNKKERYRVLLLDNACTTMINLQGILKNRKV